MASPDKVEAVQQLTDRFREASAVVFTEYRGLTVKQIGLLRAALDGQATFSVVKNTLTRRAAADAGLTVDDGLLKGPSAVAFVTGDAVLVAKGLRDFAKANPALILKAGLLDGRPLDAGELAKLADLESREVLLAKLAGALNALPQRAVSLFAAPLSQAARLFDALRAQVEANAPAEDAEAAAATVTSETAEVEAAVAADTAPVEAAVAADTEPVEAAVAADTAPVEAAVAADTAPVEAAVAAGTAPVEAAVAADTAPVADDAAGATEAAPADSPA